MLQRVQLKRIISALLVLAMLVGLLPATGVISYASMKGAVQETTSASGKTVLRGVVDDIAELPQYGKDFKRMTRGTAERPFVVLEIVPSEQFAEFGYLIGGCEPVRIEDMFGSGAMSTVATLNAADVSGDLVAYFFPDEREAQQEYYESNLVELTDTNAYQGYYEYVGDGNGKFDLSLNPNEKGCVVWHTINEFALTDDMQFAPQITEGASLPLSQIGDRYYTTRNSGPEAPVMRTNNYHTYQNREYFLIDSLRLKKEAAADYSVVIKTITPEELNQNVADNKGNDWITYADLIHISPKNHVDALPAIWEKYHRSARDAHSKTWNKDFVNRDNRDISWEAALEIYNRATQETDYAAVVIDNGIYKGGLPEEDRSAGNVSIKVLDWNGQDSGLVYGDAAGYKNNVYKLSVMLLCMKPSLFHALYLDGNDPLVKDGKHTIQEGQAQEYWNFYTFMPVPPAMDRPITVDRNLYDYWTGTEQWEKYQLAANPTDLGVWISDHVYTYNGDTSIAQSFGTGEVSSDKFADYNDYRKENEITTSRPADAVHYILRPKWDSSALKHKLRILDVEPCVELAALEEGEKPTEGGIYKKNWQLQKSYIRFLLPDYTGDIEIVHQTTAEFNGKIEDLNSTYDMIYLGLDYGAYNTNRMSLQLNDGTWISGVYPDWNDDGQVHVTYGAGGVELSRWTEGNMDGLIYFHTGDSLISTEASHNTQDSIWDWFAYFTNGMEIDQATVLGDDKREVWTSGTRSVKFLAGGKNTDELRFPGNDITTIKRNAIEDFIKAGYPVVASQYLYELQECFIDKNANIYRLVNDNKVYGTTQTAELQAAIKDLSHDEVTFDSLPNIYNGVTEGAAIDAAKANYLPQESSRSRLDFDFTITGSDEYAYRIYVDSDRDSKFTDEEIIKSAKAKQGSNHFTYRLPTTLVGLLQWKIEVYQKANPQIRYVATGCSAARKSKDSVQRNVKVLQIRPDGGGNLNLATNGTFKNYYTDLPDYTITVDSVTWEQYASCFAGTSFHYDMSKDTDTVTPEMLEQINNKFKNVTPDSSGDRTTDKLTGYNMLIIGFGDCYGGQDMYVEAAVEYIEYFAAMGKSVLFTHDLTSMYNTNINVKQYGSYQGGAFGATANAMLRDVMGMNRYKAVSNRLTAAQQDAVRGYQNQQAYYDTIDSDAIQGATYYTLKRLGAGWNINKNANNKVPYKALINRPEGGAVNAFTDSTKETGFNDDNDVTTKVRKLNEGQITEYPYKIYDGKLGTESYDENALSVAPTHGQWYQLNMEEPELTVWYCLDNDGTKKTYGDNGYGTCITYEVSPNDAANNYYIYSKGNVFYSGVGHSEVTGEMETKLFINTMIAAYRTAYEAPVIEITNDEVQIVDDTHYTIDLMVDYDFADPDKDPFAGSDEYVKIYFTPVDFNPVKTRLTGKIWIGDASTVMDYVGKKDAVVGGIPCDLSVYCVDDDGDDTNDVIVPFNDKNELVETTDASGKTEKKGLINGEEYYFKYPKKLFANSANRTITFTLMNDKTKETTTTTLTIGTEPLFLLD